ncbi:TLD domain-containing protein [Pelagicoccus sp. SDUM812005]|uniref:TLD domain-containing protein n=1 Tax=Pelagicoccus sp. SDUM812005 TaxID=3041257 RepID=UPI00280DB423|nr:TLD domain-containing protein [Pelagicoccus sp. SDUM812005]MDQ8180214.1 TLD domain-containing protein [Pelagicoccus sp. SDUM812005]
MLIATLATSTANFAANEREAEHLAIVKQWLPFYRANLQLIFEYDAEDEDSDEVTSEQLHKAIDKAGPTVTIAEVQTAFETEPRYIGGYNPYKWKTWMGRYESNAGRFVFDLKKEKRWERTTKRVGSFKASPSEYGLSFGNGDLVIHPDLKTGSAQDHTFAPPSNSSVLTGQSGEFLVKNLKVYRVSKEDEALAYAPPHPLARSYNQGPSPSYGASPNPVPDHSGFLFETIAALLSLSLFAALFRRNS